MFQTGVVLTLVARQLIHRGEHCLLAGAPIPMGLEHDYQQDGLLAVTWVQSIWDDFLSTRCCSSKYSCPSTRVSRAQLDEEPQVVSARGRSRREAAGVGSPLPQFWGRCERVWCPCRLHRNCVFFLVSLDPHEARSNTREIRCAYDTKRIR